jgi:hypothetical protein
MCNNMVPNKWKFDNKGHKVVVSIYRFLFLEKY